MPRAVVAALVLLTLGLTAAWDSARAQSGGYTPPLRGAPNGRVSGGSRDFTMESRVALVIGNAAYRHVPPLSNPVNDANAIAETLRQLDFQVIAVDDADRATTVRALGEFRRLLKADGVGLFYYAGHGLQVRGRNYLLPVDADIADENDVALVALDLDSITYELENAGVRLGLYILDACRDDPFARRGRSVGSRGLAPVDAARGSVIAFATAPGKTAADGNGDHGLFTGELLKSIAQPGLELDDVLKETAVRVEAASGNRQTPWYNSAFYGHFYFKAPVTVNVMQPEGNDRDLVFWESIKSSTDPADFSDFLKKYPKSDFASLAERRLAALNPATALPSVAAPRGQPAPNAAPSPPTSPPPAPSVTVRPNAAPSPPASPPPAPPVKARPDAGQTQTAIAVPPPTPVSPPPEGEATWSADERREVQQSLKTLGHLQGEPDGEFGPQTRAAIMQFQAFQGAAETGTLTEAERRQLLDMAHQLAILLAQPASASPGGTDPLSLRGGPQRLTRAAAFEGAGHPDEAAYWYRLAAADGEAKAFTNLGTLMVRGRGVAKPEPGAARLLWLAAAARGEPVAMFDLGAMYERGIGVHADVTVARKWYQRAAAKGSREADAALKRLGA